MPVTLTFPTESEFTEQHGDRVLIPDSEGFSFNRSPENPPHYLYETGAIWVENRRHVAGGQGIDPPSDADELLKLKIQFFTIKLERLQNDYSRLLTNVDTQSDWHSMGVGPSASEHFRGWEDRLKSWGKEIAQLKKEVKKLEKKLPIRPVDVFDRKRDKQLATSRDERARLHQIRNF